jgi:hypothetical protein
MLRPRRSGNSDSHGAFLGPVWGGLLVLAVLAAAGYGIILAVGTIMKRANEDVRPPKRTELRALPPLAGPLRNPEGAPGARLGSESWTFSPPHRPSPV